MRKIDMHFHTTLSDWSRNNNEILKEAKNKWLDFIVATEHDIINEDLVVSARMNGIKTTAWVEISSEDDKVSWKSLHLTCYSDKFWDEIKSILENTRINRKLKIKKQVDLLESNWFDINYERFIDYYDKLNVNLENLNVSHIEEYIFENENDLDSLLFSLTWEKINKWDFIARILKRNWDFNHLWWEEIDKYEPSVSKIWEITMRNKYFLSLAHSNFTFKDDEEWFLKFIEEYQDKLNWIEINSQASKKWVDLIIKTSVEYWLILTFWSDSHHIEKDSRHWELWDMNKYLSEKIIEENFEDFLYELSKSK